MTNCWLAFLAGWVINSVGCAVLILPFVLLGRRDRKRARRESK